MRLCFFGAYDSEYPRNTVIKKGLRLNGVEVSECWLPPKYKFWLRYPLLASRYLSSYTRHNLFFVPEFCQKDVPLVKILSLFSSRKIVFDPLAGRFETKIIDWKRKPLNSWQARLNFKIDYWAFKLSDLILADTQAHRKPVHSAFFWFISPSPWCGLHTGGRKYHFQKRAVDPVQVSRLRADTPSGEGFSLQVRLK